MLIAFEKTGQHFPPFHQPDVAKVQSLVVGKVKQVVDDAGRAGVVEGILQRAEVRQALLIHHHNFPVQPARAHTQIPQRLDQRRQPGAPVVAVSRDAANRCAVDAGQQAVAVKFDLVEPVPRIGRHSLDQRGQLRGQVVGQVGLQGAARHIGGRPCAGRQFFLRGLRGRWCQASLRRHGLFGQGVSAQHAVGQSLKHVEIR